ncbi:hypothetical protein M569_05957 [Genlisea aurea]|uniref:Thioredoxin domain-containing protein n=1 Tax=Genlisea aurea TaxID=192259 RepID=S8CPX2_9LAMI|nr:hypothetical protein M569_05957 [Genlisea aurea]
MICLPFSDVYALVILLCSSLVLVRTIGGELGWDGKVLELDSSNFDAAISNFDYIFVDFYAPWCGHCKRLSPELDRAAPVLAELKPPVVVAKIDADKYRNIASKHDIDGYPTLKIFMHGVAATEYFGPRKADSLVQFLKKFVAPDVTVLDHDSSIKEFVEAAGSNFPIFIGFGLNESAVSNFAKEYKKRAWFSVSSNFSDETMASYDFDKVPALAAIHPASNEQSIFYGPFEDEFLRDYIKKSLLPPVLRITQDSLKSLKGDERKVVVTILDDERDEKSLELVRVLRAAASANGDLIFGYVGLKQWPEFADSFQAHKEDQLPKAVVWNGDEDYETVIGYERFEGTDFGTQLSRFLEGYRSGDVVREKISSGGSFFRFVKSKLGMQVALVGILVVLVAALIFLMMNGEDEVSRDREGGGGGTDSVVHQDTRVKED